MAFRSALLVPLASGPHFIVKYFLVSVLFFAVGYEHAKISDLVQNGLPGNQEKHMSPELLTDGSISDTSSMQQVTTTKNTVLWRSLPQERKGFGVVYCAYGKDSNSLPRFFREANTSASLLKQNNPTISVALITNAKREEVPKIFDKIIQVDDSMLFLGESSRGDGVFRQWFTRIFYLAHSPFEVTWYVDSHAVFITTVLEQAFVEFQSSDIDFAVSNPNPNPKSFGCHNFALLFKWNDRVKNLFVDWIMEQLKTGISRDDQGTLCNALRYGKDTHGVKYASLSPQWAYAFLSLNWGKKGEWWGYRTTRVLVGKPHICHGSEENLCVVANNTGVGPRIYHYHSRTQKLIPLYNQTQVNAVLPYRYPDFDWDDVARKCSGVVCREL